ncbi:6-carboxytetrahydropterin synthase [Pseudaeromonas paramecii]|uniref:6-carboxy-5,6,7,8-tetrahydropterin synthase n=1 Tax=Pseudaeromonas paramecii TaxID=2138166 RepID=A0ABP8QES0_9GAMM
MKLFVRDLTVIDASYLCPQRGLVGESWLVDIELGGALNEMSMLLDFSRVKKQVKAVIDGEVDHRLLVPTGHPACQISQGDADRIWLDFASERGSLHLHCPAQAFCLLPARRVDEQSVGAYLLDLLTKVLPGNIEGLVLTLRPEQHVSPYYHYSHGLKKHDGNCQRIAHGHRSMIEIWVDGCRDAALEARWAQRWQDIYLGSQEDRVPIETLNLSPIACQQIGGEHLGFAYDAPQGHFELAIPAAHCELVDTDTTVELLADYIARTLRPQLSGKALRVVAYEGVGKGAYVDYPA